ncbi:MAG: plastocyanin/azurin family copper-binding protein [Bacteroidota bacterium]|nr:plastocyanin/azurin family copper-binding protein [Bacteroidota bacterium]
MKKLLFFLSVIFLFVGCDESTVPPEKTFSMPQAVDTSQTKQETINLTIKTIGNTMSDIAFDPKEIVVPVNSKVKITLTNESQGEEMNHNIVFIKMGTGDEVAREGLAIGAKKNYIPDNPNVIAGSEIALPGQTVQLQFNAPKAGSYHYICTFPGHYPQMIGRMKVVVETFP